MRNIQLNIWKDEINIGSDADEVYCDAISIKYCNTYYKISCYIYIGYNNHKRLISQLFCERIDYQFVTGFESPRGVLA